MESPSHPPQWGIVVAVQANFYRVQLDCVSDSTSRELLCTRRALLKKTGQNVVVGDRVLIDHPKTAGDRGAISEVMPRKTELSRPPIANADQILLIFSLTQPELDPFQITKFLLTAEQTHMQIIVGLSKADLVDRPTQQKWCDRLSHWGYTSIPISLISKQGIAELQKYLQYKLTILSGPSGVGKSSLINHLIPNLDVRVGAVSEKWHHGRHTTRHVELFELQEKGLLADSPGFNQPSLELEPQALGGLFPEIRAMLEVRSCQFSNCLHRNEPNCAIQGHWDRQGYYLQLLDEITQTYELSQQKSSPEKTQKLKSGVSGKAVYEPRLEQKKYRRQSRRSQNQTLEDLYSEELLS